MIEPSMLASDLRVVIGQLIRRLREERRDLTLSQVTVLGRLDRLGPASISELAADERVRPQSMTSTVAWLADHGLVERGPHAVDRRLVVVTLTEAGRKAVAEDRRRREGWLANAIERDLTERERRLLAEATLLLARLAQSDQRRPRS
jgi:DNA-binding MarR family transcriptional regulator